MLELLKSYKGCAKMQPLVAEMVPRSYCACSASEMVYRADLQSLEAIAERLRLWDAGEGME
jgi:hypothetical protein